MLGLCAATFASFGLLIVFIGAHQASLVRQLGIDLTATGLLASALTLGVGSGILAGGPLFDRLPRRPLFVGALAWVGAVMLTVTSAPDYPELIVRLIAGGFGAGVYNTLVNASISERHGAGAAAPLALVHASATVGAMFGPPLFGWVGATWQLSGSLRLVGTVHAALAIAALFVKQPARGTDPAQPATKLKAGRLWPYLGMVFGYVAAEATVTVFAVPYATGFLGLEASRGRWGITAYWFGLLLGRAGLWFARKPGLTILVWLSIGATSVLVFVGGVHLSPFELGLAAAGIMLGAIFPWTMALVGERFASARGLATGITGAAGAVGGIFVPWVAGLVGDRFGAQFVMIVAAAGTLVIVGCAATVARRHRVSE